MTYSIDMTAQWPSLPYVVVDFETTGVGEGHAPVEVSCVRFESGLPVAKFATLLNPGRDIPAESTAVHGITEDMVTNAPRLVDVRTELQRVARGAVPCAYNASFDRPMLHAAISGEDCPLFDPEFPEWIDPYVIVKDADRYVSGSGRHKLTAACSRYGIEIEGAHRALADALGCGFLLWQLHVRQKVKACALSTLLGHITKRRAEQEAEFLEWKARQDAQKEVEHV